MSSTFTFTLMLVLLAQGGAGRSNKMHSNIKSASAAAVERVAAGTWGGQHINIEVGDGGARVEFDCAHGTIKGPMMLDGQKRFTAQGTYVRERGGPLREGAEDQGTQARYAGRVEGTTMTLTVTLIESKVVVGTFTLTQGKPGRIRKCL